jgi:hypothetical protein
MRFSWPDGPARPLTATLPAGRQIAHRALETLLVGVVILPLLKSPMFCARSFAAQASRFTCSSSAMAPLRTPALEWKQSVMLCCTTAWPIVAEGVGGRRVPARAREVGKVTILDYGVAILPAPPRLNHKRSVNHADGSMVRHVAIRSRPAVRGSRGSESRPAVRGKGAAAAGGGALLAADRRHLGDHVHPCSFAVVREPIAGSQRGGLVVAAESGERISSYAGAVFCPGVVCSRSRLVCRKRGFREGQSLSGACCVEQEARIMTSEPLRQRMVAAERLLTDGDRSMKEGLGLACMPGFIQQASEVAEVYCRVRMLGAERLLVDRQRTLVERPRPRKVAPCASSKTARLLRP